MSGEKKLTFKELQKGELLRETNDLKMVASLITFGIPLVNVRHVRNDYNNRVEVQFGFKADETLKQAELAYLSRQLYLDASSLLDTREKLISYISNGSAAVLESLVKTE